MRQFGNMGMLGAILAMAAPLAVAPSVREDTPDLELIPTPKAKRHRASPPRRHPSISRYAPHQGEQEKARRVRQMARIAAKRAAA